MTRLISVSDYATNTQVVYNIDFIRHVDNIPAVPAVPGGGNLPGTPSSPQRSKLYFMDASSREITQTQAQVMALANA